MIKNMGVSLHLQTETGTGRPTGIPEGSGRRRALRLPAAAGTATRWMAPGGVWSLKMQMASAALPITTMTFCAWRQTRLVLPQGIFTAGPQT